MTDLAHIQTQQFTPGASALAARSLSTPDCGLSDAELSSALACLMDGLVSIAPSFESFFATGVMAGFPYSAGHGCRLMAGLAAKLLIEARPGPRREAAERSLRDFRRFAGGPDPSSDAPFATSMTSMAAECETEIAQLFRIAMRADIVSWTSAGMQGELGTASTGAIAQLLVAVLEPMSSFGKLMGLPDARTTEILTNGLAAVHNLAGLMQLEVAEYLKSGYRQGLVAP